MFECNWIYYWSSHLDISDEGLIETRFLISNEMYIKHVLKIILTINLGYRSIAINDHFRNNHEAVCLKNVLFP